MSSYIWSFEKLSWLSNHKDPFVREWVMERLPVLYPGKTAGIALRLINDPDEFTSLRAINYFRKSKSNSAYASQFLEFFRKSSGANAAEIASLLSKAGETALCGAFKEKYPSPLKKDLNEYSAALINLAGLRSGYSTKIVLDSLDLLREMKTWDASAAENIFSANLIAGSGLNSLFDFCFNHPQKHEATLLLLGRLMAHCGSWYSRERFEDMGEDDSDKGFPPIVRETLDYLISLGMGKTVEGTEKKWEEKDFKGVIEEIKKETMLLLEIKKQETGEKKYRKWTESDGVPLHNTDAISAIHEIVKTAPEEFHELLAKAALVIFSFLLEYKSFIGISLDGANSYYLLKIFMEDRNDHAQDEVIASTLSSSSEQEKITNILLDNLLANPYSLANRRTVQFLGEKINSEILSRLLCFDPDVLEVWEEIVRAASSIGPSAVEMIKPAFDDLKNQTVDYAICILESAPVEESVDILLRNWDALWKEKKGLLLEAVRGIGSPRFLDPLQNELREGERNELEIFCLLCRINGVDDFRFRHAMKDLEKSQKTFLRTAKALERADIDKLLEEPVEVEVKCLACGKEYHYLVRKILVDMDSNHQFILDGIVCKSCGVFDNYEITAKGRSKVHRMSLLCRIKESQSGAPAKGPISFTRQALVDGKKMSMSEILPWYENKLKEEPRNIANMIAYANVLRNQKRTEDAVSVFKEALKLDPLAMEAHAAIATVEARKGDLKSSYDRFSRASEILHSGNYYKVGPLDLDQFKETLLDNLVDVGKALGIKPAFSQEKALSSHAKTGRNEPCPCGSGKKFKKCCMVQKSEFILESPSPSSTHDNEKPVNLTDGSDKVVIAKALFDLKFFDKAMNLLEAEYDFLPDLPKNPNEKSWAWLRRGKSRELGEEMDDDAEIIFQNKVIHESGKLEWVVLGNVTMAGDRLTLECFSKGRLDAGKGRLMQILKDCVRHKSDSFEDITQSLERARQGKMDKKPETLSEEKKVYMRSYLENYYRKWLDDKIPALGGMTPREAVRDEKGRQNVLEMLRDLENEQEKKRQKGEPCFNVDFMKKELGFS